MSDYLDNVKLKKLISWEILISEKFTTQDKNTSMKRKSLEIKEVM